MRINQNIAAYNSFRNLSATNTQLGKSLEKLSSGFRINRAADDAAGLAKSDSLRAEIRGSRQAIRNAQDGVSFVQTAEGALNEVHSILQRMRELAVDAANTATTTGTAQQAEVTQLLAEIDAIGNNSTFAALDEDNDQTKNGVDNAMLEFNPDQRDLDEDQVGDVADPCPSNYENTCNPDRSGAVSINEEGGLLEGFGGDAIAVGPDAEFEGAVVFAITFQQGGEQMSIYDAAMKYKYEGTPLLACLATRRNSTKNTTPRNRDQNIVSTCTAQKPMAWASAAEWAKPQ